MLTIAKNLLILLSYHCQCLIIILWKGKMNNEQQPNVASVNIIPNEDDNEGENNPVNNEENNNMDNRYENEDQQNQEDAEDQAIRLEIIAEERNDPAYEARRQRACEISLQMTRASVNHYVSPIKQINLVIDEGKTIEEALTLGGDHNTSCAECCERHLDDCFWFFTAVDLNWEGQRFRSENPTARNNNIRHFLFDTFIEEQYCYLQRPDEIQIGMPCHLLPFCLETDIKRIYPNENNMPLAGTMRRYRHRSYARSNR